EAGEARFLAGEPAKAAEDFRAQAAAEPDGPAKQAAEFREAKCLDAAGETEAARAAYEAIAADARNPYAPGAAFQQALLTARGGGAEKALELLTALADAPDAGEKIRRDALLARGKLLEETGDTEAAYADFARLAAADGGEEAGEEADYRAARCLLALGLADDGLERLDKFVRAHPASRFRGEAMFTLAAAAYNAGEWAKAEKLFAALAHDPGGGAAKAEALFWAGKAAEAGGAGMKANAYLNELLAAEDAGRELAAEALLLQGDVLSRLGRYDAAIVAFDEVITRFPQTRQAAEARGRKGDCQYTLGESDPARYEEALLSYRTLAGEAQAADDLRIEAMYKVARAMERQGLAAAALDHYLEAVYAFLQLEDATPESAAWFTRAAYAAAAAKEAAGDWKGAAGIYGRVAGAGVPASGDAKAKREELERTHWF
ncbi:MAG: tetratricopeptide repeat protein, partial [Kiritimatiellae bacterium]|nr:tetratricopeptide repeat protein [Kiritimatiellia bacterium]